VECYVSRRARTSEEEALMKKVAIAVAGNVGILALACSIGYLIGRHVHPLWLVCLLSGMQGGAIGWFGSRMIFNYLRKE
jgi:hypothetical protein